MLFAAKAGDLLWLGSQAGRLGKRDAGSKKGGWPLHADIMLQKAGQKGVG